MKNKDINCGNCGNVGCHLCMKIKTPSPEYRERLRKAIEILIAKGYRGF